MSADSSTSDSLARRWGGQIVQIAAIVLVEDVSWSLESEREQANWVGALGHELNGALQYFQSAVQAANLTVQREPPRAQHHLEAAQRQVKVMSRLVRDFLDAARLGAGLFRCEDEPVLVSALVRDAAESAELSDPRHRVVLEVEESLWVRADIDRLRQILTNLLGNAAKYSNPGLLRVGVQRDGERVVIYVKDEGPGIAEEQQHHLFRRYRRLPSRTEGSGLGLWISRELALRMGGDLWVQSAEGEPTTFFVALPHARPDRQP